MRSGPGPRPGVGAGAAAGGGWPPEREGGGSSLWQPLATTKNQVASAGNDNLTGIRQAQASR